MEPDIVDISRLRQRAMMYAERAGAPSAARGALGIITRFGLNHLMPI